jgi:hypothetical protein
MVTETSGVTDRMLIVGMTKFTWFFAAAVTHDPPTSATNSARLAITYNIDLPLVVFIGPSFELVRWFT